MHLIVIKGTIIIRRKTAHMPNAECGEPRSICEKGMCILAIAATEVKSPALVFPVAAFHAHFGKLPWPFPIKVFQKGSDRPQVQEQ